MKTVSEQTLRAISSIMQDPRSVGQLHPHIQQLIITNPELMLGRLDRPDMVGVSMLLQVDHCKTLDDYLSELGCADPGGHVTPFTIPIDSSRGQVLNEVQLFFRPAGDRNVEAGCPRLRQHLDSRNKKPDGRGTWVSAEPLDLIAFGALMRGLQRGFPIVAAGKDLMCTSVDGEACSLELGHDKTNGRTVGWNAVRLIQRDFPYCFLIKRELKLA